MAIAVLHETAIREFDLPEAGADACPTNRRGEARLSAEDVSWLRGARLKYGPAVRVIDISTRGILIEYEGTPLTPPSRVAFELSSSTGTILVAARVVRNRSIDGNGRFRTACAFKRPLPLEALAGAADEQPSACSAPRVTWQRVVARFRDGTVARGYTHDFHPSKPYLHLMREDQTGQTMRVALSQLKAVFFVREFAGDRTRVDGTEFTSSHHGRRVEVTFEDGEVLRGTTIAFRGGGNGFFVQPADVASNNMRVFVAPGATVNVRFL
jgi:hypothetical protein